MSSSKVNPTPVWKFVLLGLICTVVATALTSGIHLVWFRLWTRTLETRPDFTGNGLNWMAIAFVTIVPARVALVDFLAFACVVPFLYMRSRDNGRTPIAVRPTVLWTATLTAVAFVLITGFGEPHMLMLLITGPVVGVQALGLWWLLSQANAELNAPILQK